MPPRRSSVWEPSVRPMKLLREVPTRIGRPSSASWPRPRSSSKLCRSVLPKPIPGSSQIRDSSIPAATAATSRAARKSRTSATTSPYSGLTCIVRGSPAMCMRTTPAPRSATSPAISGSPRRAVTSLTIVAPASSAASATGAFEVSTEISAPTPASPATTGSTRRSSSSTATSAAPGRVDSPPTSRISAPAAATPAVRDRRPRIEIEPPSENESGVTLTTPINFTAETATEGAAVGLACVAAGEPWAGTRQRTCTLAGGLFGLGGRLGGRGRLLVVFEDFVVRLAFEQGDELLGLDRLPLEQQLRDPLELVVFSFSRLFAVWWALSTMRRISSSISRAISSE